MRAPLLPAARPSRPAGCLLVHLLKAPPALLPRPTVHSATISYSCRHRPQRPLAFRPGVRGLTDAPTSHTPRTPPSAMPPPGGPPAGATDGTSHLSSGTPANARRAPQARPAPHKHVLQGTPVSLLLCCGSPLASRLLSKPLRCSRRPPSRRPCYEATKCVVLDLCVRLDNQRLQKKRGGALETDTLQQE